MKPGKHLHIAIQAAQAAGKLLLAYKDQPLSISYKKGKEVVTEADRNAESLIIKHIKKQFPSHGVWSEERDEEKTSSAYRWIIDPLDGTLMFAHGLPLFGISIGIEHNGAAYAGVTFFPVLNTLYYAQKGKGAWKAGKRLQVSSRTLSEQKFFLIGGSNAVKTTFHTSFFTRGVRQKFIKVRSLGSTALHLSYVAEGKADAALEYHTKQGDIAAGMLLVREAGGKVTDLAGRPARITTERIVASNGRAHQSLLPKT